MQVLYSSVLSVSIVFWCSEQSKDHGYIGYSLSVGIVFWCSEQSKEHGLEVGAARKNWLQSIIFIILNVTRLVYSLCVRGDALPYIEYMHYIYM